MNFKAKHLMKIWVEMPTHKETKMNTNTLKTATIKAITNNHNESTLKTATIKAITNNHNQTLLKLA